jgi:hypothetical protein
MKMAGPIPGIREGGQEMREKEKSNDPLTKPYG